MRSKGNNKAETVVAVAGRIKRSAPGQLSQCLEGCLRPRVSRANAKPSISLPMEHTTDPRVGNFAIGRHYQLLDVIGEGAYGIVW
jgi:hypothetical protein